MPGTRALPALSADWEPTRATLHAAAQAIGVVARAHARPHPQWWHVSLTLASDGLAADPVHTPEGAVVEIRLDLQRHAIVVNQSNDELTVIPLDDGSSATARAETLFSALGGVGLADVYDRERITPASGEYDPQAADTFWNALIAVASVLDEHRRSLPGDPGPLQLWPHGFDLSFEWFGSLQIEHTEGDDTSSLPSQLNLGWYPAGDAYFYSNPWPFDDDLVSQPLPGAAQWHTEGWQGSKLPYSTVVDDPTGADRVIAYAAAVFRAAAPTLTG